MLFCFIYPVICCYCFLFHFTRTHRLGMSISHLLTPHIRVGIARGLTIYALLYTLYYYAYINEERLHQLFFGIGQV